MTQFAILSLPLVVLLLGILTQREICGARRSSMSR